LARSERGAVLVEFALAMPMMAILMCAIIDFSMAMFTLNNLTTAVREGARFAAAKQTLVANDAAVVQRVQKQMSFATPGNAGKVSVSVPDPTTGNVTVAITEYKYVPVTPVAPAFGMSTINMARQAVFRWERHQDPTP
jgi:Flp pilus assembly protein TadG